MQDGLQLAGGNILAADDLACAFYGDLFRRTGRKGLGEPSYGAIDIKEGFERELLEAWWQEAAAADPNVPGPDSKSKIRTPYTIQRGLNALSRSRFFAGLAEQALIRFIKQVHRYFAEPELRADVVDRVVKDISSDTRVVVGHSLGSVVAYEALCTRSDLPVRALITLGSPLGIRNLIFDRLQPPPIGDLGSWPGGLLRWTNVADDGDIVALVKELRPRFGYRVEDLRIHNAAKAHDISPYLTAKETGRAILAGAAGRAS
jgi:hypothetical protein